MPYDVGYYLTPRDDGTFIYGFEIVQEACDGRLGGGACTLDFQGSLDDAERYLIKKLEQMVKSLPDRGNRTDTRTARKRTKAQASMRG
ncbi:hypothetical protein WK52_15420 [Burkholderia multivorans]|nr:hypothetical protein WK52_15420 [Burkholderia multivorans]